MALTTRSMEMSFSASMLRRTVMSMSIRSLLVRTAGLAEAVEIAGVVVRQSAELHLHPARPEVAVADRALRTVDLQRDALVISSDYSRLLLNGITRGGPLRIMILIGQGDNDQPSYRAAPVLGLGQRAVDTRRRHLQRVGGVAHRVLGVEPRRYLAADLGDGVEADPSVGVHHDAQHPAPPDRPDRDGLQVHAHRAQHGFDQARNARRVRRAGGTAAVAGTGPAAVRTQPTASRATAAPGRHPAARVAPRRRQARSPCLPRRAAPGVLAHHASCWAT